MSIFDIRNRIARIVRRKGALLLSLIMAVTMMPAYALAETPESSEPSQEVQIDAPDIPEEATDNAATDAVDDQVDILQTDTPDAETGEQSDEKPEEPSENSTVQSDTAAEEDVTYELLDVGQTLSDSDILLSQYIDAEVSQETGMSSDQAVQEPSAPKMLRKANRYYRLENEAQRDAYNQMKATVSKIAAGELSSSVITVTGPRDLDYGLVLRVLMQDLPYDFYWFDNTQTSVVGITQLSDAKYKFSIYLNVSVDYSDGVLTEQFGRKMYVSIDTAKTRAAANTVNNIAEIIRQHADDNDVVKLHAYLDEICDLTSYDYDAAAQIEKAKEENVLYYGNPWQLISVFDGDTSTLTVCEGYSKAFKYLCDLTSFENSIECYTVTGVNHMWNILRMEDGRNYIADLTNCDVNNTEDLFLKGCLSGSAYTYYIYKLKNRTIRYEYDSEITEMFSEAELTMSAMDYTGGIIYVPAEAATCTAAGNTEYWKSEDRLYGDCYCENEIAEEDTVIKALGHNWYVSHKSLDYNIQKCRRCGITRKVATVTVSGPKLTIKKPSRAKKAFTAKWKKLSAANRKKVDGIEIQYSTNKSFTDATSKVITAKKTAASRKITKLKSKQTYYVRVRTYKRIKGKKYVSKWSAVKSVKTK